MFRIQWSYVKDALDYHVHDRACETSASQTSIYYAESPSEAVSVSCILHVHAWVRMLFSYLFQVARDPAALHIVIPTCCSTSQAG